MNFGFIGAGNMGFALAKAIGGENKILLSDLDAKKVKSAADTIGAMPSNNTEIAEKCDFIFLAVKPQVMFSVLEGIKDTLKKRLEAGGKFVIVTMAAGLSIESILTALESEYPIIRIMPNTPVAVGEGMILYTYKNVLDEDKDLFIGTFASALKGAGKLRYIDEKLIDAASAVSGCGPAFGYMFIEALAMGGVECGLSYDLALELATQTVLGSAVMISETGTDPQVLRTAVCSPAGTTIEGVHALESGAFNACVMNAVKCSFERTKELSQKKK